jgi:putative transposase
MIVTYQYRLLPSKRQHRTLEALLESQRLLYNAALEERIGAYRRGVVRTCVDQMKALTEWRQSDPEAASIPANLQRATLKRLDHAYNVFFRRLKKKQKAGFPRFRGRGWWDSFGFQEFKGIRLVGRRLRFKGMPGGLEVHFHRALPEDANIRSCTFKRDTKGWKVGFAVEVPVQQPRNEERRVGIDLGLTTFAALSDGGFIPSLRAARRAAARLRRAQRSLQRKQRGSKSRAKARRELARCHAAITRRRTEHLNQASARLIRDYDVIAVERLNVDGLAKGMFSRDVQDASWGRFLFALGYKAARAGVRIIEVDARNSTQDCSGCGALVQKIGNERWHECPHCGLSMDRDLNAARNILYRAGVGPSLLNVADDGKRAGGNLETSNDANAPVVAEIETLPFIA